MGKKIILIISIIQLCSLLLFASPSERNMYDTDSRIYTMLNLLMVYSGGTPLSDSGPWSQAELESMLNRLDLETLSDEAQDIYRQLRQELTVDNNTDIRFGLHLNGETYFHTNTGTFFNSDEQWVNDYSQRTSLADVSLQLGMGEYLFGEMNYEVRNNRFHPETEDTTGFFGKQFATNFIFDDSVENLNVTNPWTAYLSVGGSHWNIQFGRDTQSWGNSFLGNLVVNDHVDFHEYLTFSAFNDRFKLLSTAMIFDHPSSYGDSPENSPSSTDPITGYKMFIAHRLEIPVGKRIRVSLTEGMMIQSPDNSSGSIKFSWLNPLMLYHNYYMAGTSNSIAGVSISAHIIPGMKLYGQFVLDEVGAVTETNQKPNAFGYLAGLMYTRPLLEKHMLTLTIEAALTDPFLYHRGDDIDFLVAQRQPVSAQYIPGDEDFLGFPYGSDVLIFGLKAHLHSLSYWEGYGSIVYMQKGCIDENSTYQTGTQASGLETPTSTDLVTDKDSIEHRLIISADTTQPLTEKLSVRGHIDWIHRWNPENYLANPYTTDIQITASVTFQF